jgi:hypothetical protein
VSPRPLIGIGPDASAEEVAAVLATIAVLEQARAGVTEESVEPASRWVRASRLTARRAGMQRGEYRLSGRMGRRARA